MAEIYLEITQVGRVLRVAAIDGATGQEAVVSGPPEMVESLKRTAVKKLEYIKNKR
jgi:hypothetical protein